MMPTQLSQTLRQYFAQRPEVAVAYLFGSSLRPERSFSRDVDVGLVFGAALGIAPASTSATASAMPPRS